jgi:murein DD-endopeptidase MepM/ murein hydrolase activator NlpD
VSKGLQVKVGDVLGYTSYNPRREKNNGKVYFEVRKKNKVQNTIELMNASSLDREVLASR